MSPQRIATRALNSARVRLKRKLESLRPGERIRASQDASLLVDRFPQLAEYAELSRPIEASLSRLHEEYVSGVSSRIMAASLEVSCFLRCFLELVEASHVADLGSGFSSLVLRLRMAHDPSLKVWSVDDNPYWLGKTEDYLVQHGVNIERLLDWTSFVAEVEAGQRFDVLFHDAGSMEFRADVLETVIAAVRPGGWILLDDMHKRDYRERALKILARNGVPAWSLRAFTLDGLTRFAFLAHRPSNSSAD